LHSTLGNLTPFWLQAIHLACETSQLAIVVWLIEEAGVSLTAAEGLGLT
jgi:hypothetical protein